MQIQKPRKPMNLNLSGKDAQNDQWAFGIADLNFCFPFWLQISVKAPIAKGDRGPDIWFYYNTTIANLINTEHPWIRSWLRYIQTVEHLASIFKNNFDTYWPYYIKITKNKLQSLSYDYISAKPYMQMADERF